MDLFEPLSRLDQGDFLRGIAKAVLQLIFETDVEGLIGAGRHERSGERTTWRNGYRERALDTRQGTLNLRVPNLRKGSHFPRLPRASAECREGADGRDPGGLDRRRLDPPRRRTGAGDGPERHLGEHGVEALQGSSRGNAAGPRTMARDERVGEFLNPPLTGDWPCVWLDATCLKARRGGLIAPVDAIIAVAADTEGRREIIGPGIGPPEAETFWAELLRSLATGACAV